jgi:hypothetical protein
MKKILFLLFLPTLLFSQRKIVHTSSSDTAYTITKWKNNVVNFDSAYEGGFSHVQMAVFGKKLGDSEALHSHFTRYPLREWTYFHKKSKKSKYTFFVEGLGMTEVNSRKINTQFFVKDHYYLDKFTFKGTTAFNGTHFLKGLITEKIKFLGLTSFAGATFDSVATFTNAYFKDNKIAEGDSRYSKLFDGRVSDNDTISSVVFTACKFSNLWMDNAIFDSSVDFIDALFHKKAHFSGCEFNKNVFFTQSQFDDEIYFYKAHFTGETNFKGVQFENRADFTESIFGGITSWDKTVFYNTANFSKATFKQTPSFDKTQLPFYLHLTNLNLKEINAPIRFDLALTDSLQKRWGSGQKCHVYLNTFTDISKIVLDASKFTIVFDSTMKHDDKIGVYEQVIKKCKEIGFGESTKGFDIELQKLQLRHSYPITGNFLIWLNDYWWNFGYEKSKIFRNTGIAFLLSFLIFFFRLPDYARVYFPSQMGISDEMASKLHLFTWMRFRVALFYTALIFFTWKMEHGEVNYRNYPLKTLFIYFVFTVGIIHLAYLAGAVISR